MKQTLNFYCPSPYHVINKEVCSAQLLVNKLLIRAPFFGSYLSRNKFQDILWNFQVVDAKNNPPPGSLNHDPLAKVRPLLEMCQLNFSLWCTPSEYISLNESTMVFKGCVKFLQFNPSKPNKFHIKLFMVSEHLSGYISGFSVYTGKTANELIAT